MAEPTQRGTGFPIEKRFILAMDKEVGRTDPDINVFLALASRTAKEVAPNNHFYFMDSEWFVQRFVPNSRAAVTAFATPVITVTLDNAEDFRAFEVSEKDETEGIRATITTSTTTTVAYLRSLTSDGSYPIDRDAKTVKFEKASGDDPATAACSIRVETAGLRYDSTDESFGGFYQGSGAPAESRKRVHQKDAATEIFKTQKGLTDTLMNSDLYTGSERTMLHADMFREHLADINYAMHYAGRGHSVCLGATFPTDESPKTYLTGLGIGVAGVTGNDKRGWIRSKNYQGLDAVDTEWQVDVSGGYGNFFTGLIPIQRKIMKTGASISPRMRHCLCSGLWLNAFELGMRADARYVWPMSAKEYGMDVWNFRSIGGLLKLVYDPTLDDGYEEYMAVLDFSQIKYRPHNGRDTRLELNIEDNDTDGIADQYLTEVGLQMRHEETSAILYLKTS